MKNQATSQPTKGLAMYCRVLVAVGRGGLTTAQVAQQAGITRSRCCLDVLNGMRALGLVRREPVRARGSAITYGWWLGRDTNLQTRLGKRVPVRAQLILFASLVRAASQRLTLPELAAEVGLSVWGTRCHLSHGRGEVKVFPIVAYRNRDRRRPVYGFQVGGQDVERPPRKTRREQNADAYRRLKAKANALPDSAPLARLVRAHSIFNPAAVGAAINP